jgi:hypothetical protein
VYESRIADARELARVVLFRSAGGVAVDIALSALPFEEARMAYVEAHVNALAELAGDGGCLAELERVGETVR